MLEQRIQGGNMKKSELKTGMRVRMRNNEIYLVLKDVDTETYGHQDIIFVRKYGFMTGSNYDENSMKICGSSSDFDIMEVFNVENNIPFSSSVLDLSKRHSIWQRQEFTEEQKEIFKALRLLGFKHIVRDKNNNLYTYILEPIKNNTYWVSNGDCNDYLKLRVNENLFSFIKWEDAEPFEIPIIEKEN
jgi:hypothetical protein